MNLGQMVDRVLETLDEEVDDPTYWTRRDCEDSINEGLVSLADFTEYNEVTLTIPQLAFRQYYDLRSHVQQGEQFLAPRRVHNLATNRWLPWSSARVLDHTLHNQWEGTPSACDKVVARGLFWLGVYGTASGDTGVLRAPSVTIPNLLTVDEDEPQFPRQFHLGLVEYALYDLEVQDGELDLALDHYDAFTGIAFDFQAHVERRQSVDKVWGLREARR